MPEKVIDETISVDGKTYTKKITTVGVYQWLLLFLVAVIAFGILATWIRLGSMMDPNHPFLAAIHGVYINESGKPEMRMIRVDQNGFLGTRGVQVGNGGNSPVPVPVPVPSVQVPPVEIPAAPAPASTSKPK